MKILILNIYFHPDPTGTGLVVTELARDLVAEGNQVTVVTSMPHHGLDALPPTFRHKLIHHTVMDGIHVWRTYVYVPRQKTVLPRAINYLSYTSLSLVAGLLSGRHDVVMWVCPPPTVGVTAWLLSRLKRVPLLLNAQDIYPDSVVATGVLRNPLAIAASRRLERFLYRAADKIVVLCQGMQDNLLAKGVPASKLEIIPNWANVDEIRPLPKENEFRDAHNLNGRFVVLFAGNLGVLSGLDVVLDTARQLQDQPHIQFLIVGRGNAGAHLVRRAEELRLTNLRFLPTQPREVLPEMLAAADLSLVTLHPRLSNTNVPSKTYSIMASARPILAAVSPANEVARLVREVECGIWVPPGCPDHMAQAILDATRQPDHLEHYGRNGRAYVVAHNARPMLTRRYHDLLHEVAGL